MVIPGLLQSGSKAHAKETIRVAVRDVQIPYHVRSEWGPLIRSMHFTHQKKKLDSTF